MQRVAELEDLASVRVLSVRDDIHTMLASAKRFALCANTHRDMRVLEVFQKRRSHRSNRRDSITAPDAPYEAS